MISNQGLLFIEPGQAASPTPVVDHITRRMCAAFRQAKESDYAYGGIHRCICGAHSSSSDYHLPSGDLTNSLCVHYVAHHRAQVPQQQLARIEAFTFGEVEPTWSELHSPEPILGELPVAVRQALSELEAQIESLNQERKAAVAEQDFEKAFHLRDQADKLKKKKETITRESRIRYAVEHFGAIADPLIKLWWGVKLISTKAASPEVVNYLRAVLESTGQSKILSDRLGSEFDKFVERLKVKNNL
jgi:hypothetical protein